MRGVSYEAMRAEEHALRALTDFTRSPEPGRLGADPYDVVAVGRDRFVGLERSPGRLVVFDSELRTIASWPNLSRPRAIAASGRRLLVASDRDARIRAFEAAEDAIVPRPERDLEVGGASVRALAFGAGESVFALDEIADELVMLTPDGRRAWKTPAAPFSVVVAGKYVVVASSIGHAISAAPLGEDGAPTGELRSVTHDGPFFGLAAVDRGDAGLLFAAGGVEDVPLDRTGGFFGNIDSFVYLYSFDGSGFRRLAAVNTSEIGVVTPKAIDLRIEAGEAVVVAAGYASESAAVIRLPLAGEGGARASVIPSLPGLTTFVRDDGGRLVGPSPLLDGWVALREGTAPQLVETSGARDEVFLGEALFATTLMAPWQSSDGKKSRFTCETCHFEGGVDGRTHHTGRGDVRATTKPLRGLFSNPPHFTRALDADTTEMIFAEFGVAAAASSNDGWFGLDDAPLGWTGSVRWESGLDRSPVGLRRALLAYLAYAAHPPNPRVTGRQGFDAVERRGADLFAATCEGCHAARLVANDPGSAVPRDRWEASIFTEVGPIVWARDGYEKTGVEPYVHPEGARPTSLRRLEDKRPYFTNGSAKSLDEVLERARFGEGDRFFHDGSPPDSRALSADEREALLAFLRLL